MKRILLQNFEWYMKPETNLWAEIARDAYQYAQDGITESWLPPAYKAKNGINDVGYGVYDLYDLGEFNQKNTVRTKYGTCLEYEQAIKALQAQKIKVYADIVLNHKMGADGVERVNATVSHATNRLNMKHQTEIEAWTVFNFDNRNNMYSDFKWNKHHFKAVDFDHRSKTSEIYLFDGKSWSENIDVELGNYDYLMGADIDVLNPEVRQHLKDWGHWYTKRFGLDGYRIDAVKHIDFDFYYEWLQEMRSEAPKYAVGEYWSPDLRALHNYLQETQYSMSLFDVPLHFNFHIASFLGDNYDLRKIFNGTLVATQPEYAVTFVDNHDTQVGQSLESYVKHWFRYHAYALILLRTEGVPCVFYPDYKTHLPKLARMMRVSHRLNGKQFDMIDDTHVIGWSFDGDYPGAVVMSNRYNSIKKMYVGKQHAGKEFVDLMEHTEGVVTINEKGIGLFPVAAKVCSVYITKENYHESIL